MFRIAVKIKAQCCTEVPDRCTAKQSHGAPGASNSTTTFELNVARGQYGPDDVRAEASCDRSLTAIEGYKILKIFLQLGRAAGLGPTASISQDIKEATVEVRKSRSSMQIQQV